MIQKFFKFLLLILITFSFSAYADDHKPSKEIINDLKSEIKEYDASPKKRKFLQGNKKYIGVLKDQLEELKKEKAKREKIDAVKEELVKELEKLGEKPLSETKDIDADEEIIALRKQLEELKAAKEKEEADKKKQEEIDKVKNQIVEEIEALGGKPISETSDIDGDQQILALKNQLEELKTKIKEQEEQEKKEAEEKKKAKEKKKAEEKKKAQKIKDRNEAIQNVKREILFLGETPLSEFEVNNEDQYIAALNEQLEEIKILKAQEEKEIQQSIPTWFIKVPRGDEKKMYVRGTAVVDTLQGSIDSATNAALRELGKKLETRLNSKINETVRQAGMGEDIVTKTEMNRISSIVVKEVTISGYEIAETKMVQLDNGRYRSFILIEYPIAQIYKAFINRIEKSPELKSSVVALKDTETFKELENYIAEFSGA